MLAYVRRLGLFRPGERVLAGVSGGPDSTTLLLVLAHLRDELGLELIAAHFDHSLRSRREAEEDAAFVGALAEGLGLPLVRGRGDVRAEARAKGESIEEAARRLRYAFLAREARRAKATAVAVGHTRDDLAETVLLHIVRGSGLDGLVGMRPRSRWPFGRGPALVRPLLDIPREETERYCRETGITPRQDPTNFLPDATRNRVRAELLPLLRQFNPRIREALARLASGAATDAGFIDSATSAAWRALAQREVRAVRFGRAQLEALAPALAGRLLRRAARHLAGAGTDLEAVHLEAAMAVLTKRRSTVSLAHGLTFSVDGRSAVVRRGDSPRAEKIPSTPIAVPGRTVIPGWTVQAAVVSSPEGRPRGRYEAYLDAGALGPTATVRSRRPGDRLRPLGLGGEKKVQDLLVDAKVPREERDGVPIVCAPWGVAWVVGHRLDQRVALTADSRSALRLRFRRRRRD